MDRQFEYISVIAAEESILRASERLYVTPSALSKYVQKLEDSLGIKLFDRVGKKFILTYAGSRFLSWQEQINHLQENLDNEMRNLANMESGQIRIGVQLVDSKLLIEKVIPAFHSNHPKIQIEIIQDSVRVIRDLLEGNRLDFAFLTDYMLSGDIQKINLAPSNPVLVVQKGCRLEQLAEYCEGFPYPWIDYEYLKDARFIVPYAENTGAYLYRALDEFKRQCGFELQHYIMVKYVESRVACVKQGLGITYADDYIMYANFDMDDLALLSYGSKPHVEQKVIAYHKDHYLSLACREMIRLYQEEYSKLPMRQI